MRPLRFPLIAVTIGCIYGIIEGVESSILSTLPSGLTWSNGNSPQALVVMPLVYPVAYAALGLLLVPLALLVRRDWWDVVLVFLLASLSGYLIARNQQAVFSSFASGMLGMGIGTVVTRIYRKRQALWERRLVRAVPWALALAGLTAIGASVGLRFAESRRIARLPKPPADAPNVLLIVLDTERADHLSSYGYPRPTTPHLDSLAGEGVLFERAYAASSWTLPSHASLFTGRMKHEHERGKNGMRRLGPGFPTIAEVFRDHGYATAGFVANTFWASRQSGLNRGFVHYEDFYGTLGDALQRAVLFRESRSWLRSFGTSADIRGRKRASHVNREFLRWARRRDERRPWFVFLNYMDVHAPYLPPAPFAGTISPIDPDMSLTQLDMGQSKETRLSPARVASKTDRYDESLRYLDWQLGNLFAELRRRGELDNTVVIVTADHGEHLGEHGIVQHGASLYAQEIHVPLIIRFPRKVVAGRVAEPVSTTNLAATILPLTGVPASFPGRSLLLADTESGPDPQPTVSEMSKAGGNDPPEWPASRGWLKSLVVGRWHVILRENGTTELFDVVLDPQETRDLAGTAEGKLVSADLQRRLNAITQPVVSASIRR